MDQRESKQETSTYREFKDIEKAVLSGSLSLDDRLRVERLRRIFERKNDTQGSRLCQVVLGVLDDLKVDKEKLQAIKEKRQHAPHGWGVAYAFRMISHGADLKLLVDYLQKNPPIKLPDILDIPVPDGTETHEENINTLAGLFYILVERELMGKSPSELEQIERSYAITRAFSDFTRPEGYHNIRSDEASVRRGFQPQRWGGFQPDSIEAWSQTGDLRCLLWHDHEGRVAFLNQEERAHLEKIYQALRERYETKSASVAL